MSGVMVLLTVVHFSILPPGITTFSSSSWDIVHALIYFNLSMFPSLFYQSTLSVHNYSYMSHSSHLLPNSLNLYLCLLQLFHDVHRVPLGLQWMNQDSLTPTQPAVKCIVQTLWEWQVETVIEMISFKCYMPSHLTCYYMTTSVKTTPILRSH